MQLQQLSVLNTRPTHQSAELTELLQQQGISVLSCPTIDIHPVELASNLKSSLAKPSEFDLLVVTSVNALWGWLWNCPDQFTGPTSRLDANAGFACGNLSTYQANADTQACPMLAIGQATENAAKALGFKVLTFDRKHFDSEALMAQVLAQAEAQQLVWSKQPKVGILSGVGGRTVIRDGFRQMATQVVEFDVYQRQGAAFCAQSWQQWQHQANPVLLISSLDSFRKLHQNLIAFDERYSQLSSPAWQFLQGAVVFSQRILDQLQAEGWQVSTQVTPIQSNQGILQALQFLVESA